MDMVPEIFAGRLLPEGSVLLFGSASYISTESVIWIHTHIYCNINRSFHLYSRRALECTQIQHNVVPMDSTP
jgi:hypothetical protein